MTHACGAAEAGVGGIPLLCRIKKLLDFIKNILICVLKMNEGLTGLE